MIRIQRSQVIDGKFGDPTDHTGVEGEDIEEVGPEKIIPIPREKNRIAEAPHHNPSLRVTTTRKSITNVIEFPVDEES